MVVKLFRDKKAAGAAAARQAAGILRSVIAERGSARIIAATGASQFDFLDALTATPEIDWKKVEMFHLDEYVGLSIAHPASFRRYLRERLLGKTGIERAHLLDGEGDVGKTLAAASEAIARAPIDVCFCGIGENSHLAFNDPPADFITDEPYITVELDEACRRQQVGEGWFENLAQVPRQAITMSIKQIMKSREILCIVPDTRKADAVKATLTAEVDPRVPASILRTHGRTTLFLDPGSASKLDPALITERV